MELRNTFDLGPFDRLDKERFEFLITFLKDRGNLILVYALWKSKNGGFGFEVMSKEDVDDHARRFSQSFGSSYSPWKTNYEEMAKKTVIKKCLKYAPLKTDFVMQMLRDTKPKNFSLTSALMGAV